MIDKEMLRKGTGLFAGFSVKSLAFTWAYIYFVAEQYLITLFLVFIGWNGYLMAHYLVTGNVIDDRVGDKELKNGERLYMLAPGIVLFGSGMSMCIHFLNVPNILGSYIGMMMVFAGYVVIHYESSGSLI